LAQSNWQPTDGQLAGTDKPGIKPLGTFFLTASQFGIFNARLNGPKQKPQRAASNLAGFLSGRFAQPPEKSDRSLELSPFFFV
jgi:hypothetical protein